MKITPYSQNDFTPIPTKFTKFRRNCVLWQIVRFLVINFKMTVLLLKSHH
ncbi:hypothetical protein [Sulfurospirillum sp. 1612]